MSGCSDEEEISFSESDRHRYEGGSDGDDDDPEIRKNEHRSSRRRRMGRVGVGFVFRGPKCWNRLMRSLHRVIPMTLISLMACWELWWTRMISIPKNATPTRISLVYCWRFLALGSFGALLEDNDNLFNLKWVVQKWWDCNIIAQNGNGWIECSIKMVELRLEWSEQWNVKPLFVCICIHLE